jgi:hypothetical protein
MISLWMLESLEIGLRLGWELVYFSALNLVLFLNMVNAFYFLLLQITGIYMAMSIRVGPTQRTVKSILKVNAIDICHITIVESFVSETASNPVLLFSHGILSSFRHSLIALHIKKTDKSRLHVETSHFNTSKFVCFRPETVYTICTFRTSGCVINYMSYS